MVDITGDAGWFAAPRPRDWLKEHLPPHRVLCVVAPVYAHHLQHQARRLIRALPAPDGAFGALALPVLCYGGLSTGVAMGQTARLLRRSGRMLVGAARVACPHTISMLPQIATKVNRDRPGPEEEAVVRRIAERIASVIGGRLPPRGEVEREAHRSRGAWGKVRNLILRGRGTRG